MNSDEHLLTAFLKAISLVITSPARLRVKNDMVQSSHVSIKRFYKRADTEKEFTASIHMHKYISPRHLLSWRELKPKNVKREDGLYNPITCQRFYLYLFCNKTVLSIFHVSTSISISINIERWNHFRNMLPFDSIILW